MGTQVKAGWGGVGEDRQLLQRGNNAKGKIKNAVLNKLKSYV